MVKCVMCKTKKDIADMVSAVQCNKCKSYYHPGCFKRAIPSIDGGYVQCCSSNKTLTRRNSASSNDSTMSKNDDNAIAQLDSSQLALWILMKPRLDNIEVVKMRLDDIESTLTNLTIGSAQVNSRIDKLEDRFVELENSVNYVDIYDEIKDRLLREKNFIIYNLPDSSDASVKDSIVFNSYLLNSNLDIPFEIKGVKLVRLGRKYAEGITRPVKVIMKTSDNVHWIFLNRSTIFPSPIFIRSDITKKQQEFYNKVKDELNNRIANGEKNIRIKHVRGKPTIVKDVVADNTHENDDSTSSKNGDGNSQLASKIYQESKCILSKHL